MRIDRVLSNLKYGSRKQIKDFVSKELVEVNNEVIKNSAYKVSFDDEITLDGIKIYHKEHVTIALNKPVGYLSATYDRSDLYVNMLIGEPYNRYDLKIAGRLDKDAEGLLILSTDGKFIHEVTSPNYKVEKTYEVLLDNDFTHLDELAKGVLILDDRNREYFAEPVNLYIKDDYIYITITEGKFHQVKRMFSYFGYEVVNLKRIKIGKYHLDNLKDDIMIEIRRDDVIWWKLC